MVVATLWFFDLSWWGLLLVVVVIATAECVVYRVADDRTPDPLGG